MLQVSLVSRRFNARRTATKRTYVYRIICPVTAQTTSVFQYNNVWASPVDLDVAHMQAAGQLLRGRHDFTTFRSASTLLPYWMPGALNMLPCCLCMDFQHWIVQASLANAGCKASSPIRDIDELEVLEQDARPAWAPACSRSLLSTPSQRSIIIRVAGRSFLYHQVRRIVSWLVEVGAGRRQVAETHAVLAAKSVDALGVKTAPSWGLTLCEVHYDDALLASERQAAAELHAITPE
jgi:tRNA pseudouridine38-40 synthase